MHPYLQALYQALCATRPGSSIRLRWHRLWVRADEHHASLDQDTRACLHMSADEMRAYYHDLSWRREIAHTREIPGPTLYYSRFDMWVVFLRRLHDGWKKFREEDNLFTTREFWRREFAKDK